MSHVRTYLASLLARFRNRTAAIVVVTAIAGALGVALASVPAGGGPTEAAPAGAVAEANTGPGSAVPVEAAFDRPVLDIDGFTELERRLADERRERAQDLLDRLYPGLAFVTVGVELDPRWERTSEKIQPEWPAVIEEERPEAGASGSRTRVYEPFAGTRETGLLAPQLRRVSVALVLDSSIAGDRSRQSAIVAAVTNAVGPAGDRAPDVEVLVDDLPTRPATQAAVAPGGWGLPFLEVELAGWAALVALAALSLAWTRMRRAARDAVPVARSVAPAAPEVDEGPGLRQRIEQTIDDQPESIARVVEGWLAEAKT